VDHSTGQIVQDSIRTLAKTLATNMDLLHPPTWVHYLITASKFLFRHCFTNQGHVLHHSDAIKFTFVQFPVNLPFKEREDRRSFHSPVLSERGDGSLDASVCLRLVLCIQNSHVTCSNVLFMLLNTGSHSLIIS